MQFYGILGQPSYLSLQYSISRPQCHILLIYISLLQYSIFRPQCHILLIYISLYSTASPGPNAIYCSYISLFTVQHLQASMPYIAHIYLSLQYSIIRPQCHILLTCISLYSTASPGLNAIYCSYISPFYSTVSSGLNAIYCSYISLFTVQHLQASMPYIAHMYLSLQYSICSPHCHILLICISLYSTASAVLNAIYCSYVSLFTVQYLQASMPCIAHMYLTLQYSICSPQCHILLTCISLYSTVSSGLRPQCHILLICISLYSTVSAGLNAIYCSYVSLFTVQHLQASMPYIAHMYLSLQYSICRPQCHILLICISFYSTASVGLNAIYCSYVSLFTVQYL